MIMAGICQLSLIPVSKEPSERSEMVNQLLYGETFDILDTNNRWSFIRGHLDGYTGWIITKMATPLTQTALESYSSAPKVYLKEPIYLALPDKNLYIPGGSTLPEKHTIVTTAKDINFHRNNSPVDIPNTALKFIGAPYLWGGRTIFGIDCSGLTQIVYKMNGIVIPRDAYQQAEQGKTITSVEESHPGDLAFFQKEDGHIIHTGIILDNSRIIHASGQVRIDKIDDHGILNTDTNEYSHKLKTIKRII